MALSTAITFKTANLGSLPNVTAMRGRMGMALPPGSTHVLDRRTKALVPCTPERCPLAQGSALDKVWGWWLWRPPAAPTGRHCPPAAVWP